jgi:ankyrin repeat protein
MRQEWRAALERRDIASLEAQLAAGADIDVRDEHGQTGLMNAARDGRAEVVRLLVERGAALDAHAKYGLTAIMLAVLRQHHEVVAILVRAGADVGVRGTGAPGFFNKTARDLAESLGDERSIALLDGR